MNHTIVAATAMAMITKAANPPKPHGSATRIADKNSIRGTIPANERRTPNRGVESVRNCRCKATTAAINSMNSLSHSS